MDEQTLVFARLTKVDEEKREVTGLATEEIEDHAGEMMDYKSSKPYFSAWSKETAKITNGKSLGAVREMHASIAAGKLVSMEFIDSAKKIMVTAKVVDDQSWEKVKDGVLTGFSIGGSYVKLWKDEDLGVMRFTAKPIEISLVDRPCVPTATFEYIKSDGSTEMRKFLQPNEAPTEETMTPEQIEAEVQKRLKEELAKATAPKTKMVAGEELPADCFAFVGDVQEPKTWKLAIKFADAEKTKRAITNSLAGVKHCKSIPPAQKAEVKAKIHAAAKAIQIELEDKQAAENAEAALKADFIARIDKAAEAGGMKKGLYEVKEFASLLQTLFYLFCSARYEADYEEDESPIPDELEAHLNGLAETFLAMATEEIKELTAAAAGKGAMAMSEKNQDLLKASRGSLQHHFKKSKAYHERQAAHYDGVQKEYTSAAEHFAKGDSEDAKVQAKLYKTLADENDKLMKSHLSRAEQLDHLAQSMDEDAEKADSGLELVKADATKTEGEPTPEALAEMRKNSSNGTLTDFAQDLMKKTATEMTTKAIDDFKNSEEGKKLFADAAAQAIRKTVGDSIKPDGVQQFLQPRPGQPGTEADRNVAKAASPSKDAGL